MSELYFKTFVATLFTMFVGAMLVSIKIAWEEHRKDPQCSCGHRRSEHGTLACLKCVCRWYTSAE